MPHRFPLIAAMILLPVLALAGGAAWGLRAQGRAAEAEAKESAHREAAAVAEALADRLAAEARRNWVRLYPAVPAPVEAGRVSPAYAAGAVAGGEAPVEENTPSEKEAGATDTSAATLLRQAAAGASAFELTPAGLPVGPLAALEQLERAPDAEQARRVAALALHFAPSAVSPLVLARAEEVLREKGLAPPPALAGWRETWAELEARRAVLAALGGKTAALSDAVPRPVPGAFAEGSAGILPDHAGAASSSLSPLPSSDAAPATLAHPGSMHAGRTPAPPAFFWVIAFPPAFTSTMPLTREGETRDVPADGRVFGVLSSREVREAAHAVWREWQPRLPAWAALALDVSAEAALSVAPPGAGETVATSADPARPFAISIVEKTPGARGADHRRLAAWAWSLVGAAVGIAALGLALAQRTLARERRLGELKSQFVSSVSHELRAPIGSLRLMAEGLASGKIAGEGAADFHRLMAREGARLSSLIENVLDFARIEQGRKQYTRAETDLPALIRDTARLMQPQAETRRIALRLELPDAPFTPSIDAAALQQALINLLDNALKFAPENSEVVVRLDFPNETIKNSATAAASSSFTHPWSLSVIDHGPGIPAPEHTRIFERFYRLGNELRRETQGAGIGLSLVKHIAEGHGGRVEVISEERRADGSGGGSEMRMVFV